MVEPHSEFVLFLKCGSVKRIVAKVGLQSFYKQMPVLDGALISDACGACAAKWFGRGETYAKRCPEAVATEAGYYVMVITHSAKLAISGEKAQWDS